MTHGARKLALGGVLAATTQLALPSPAAALEPAGETSQTTEVNYTWDNGPYTCDLTGVLRWDYDDESSTTFITAYTDAAGDPECTSEDFALHTVVRVVWTTDEQTEAQSSRSFGRGESTILSLGVQGRLTSLNGNHHWSYNCEESDAGIDFCEAEVATKAK